MTKVIYRNSKLLKVENLWLLDLIFLILFLAMSLGMTYHEILFERPQGVHVWRQTDCASMAINYYQNDLPLLKPQLHYRFNENAEAMGEFPIAYYTVAKLYGLFGFNEAWYRALWWLMAFVGSFCLYRLAYEILDMPLESLFIGTMLFLSPVVAFYSINFISDPIALYLVPISFYALKKYYDHGKTLHFIVGILTLTLSGLLKLSALVIPLSILGAYGLYFIFNKKWIRLFQTLAVAVLILLINLIWYKYAMSFNEERNTGYFFTKLAPIWELSNDSIKEVRDILWDFRLQEFYNKWLLAIAIVFLTLGFVFRFKSWWTVFYLLLISAVSLFFLVFFQQFRYHDYYMITMVMFVPIIFIYIFQTFANIELNKRIVRFIKFLILFLMLRDTVIAANFVKRRYKNPENPQFVEKGYFNIEAELEKHGITRDSYVISIHDESPNTTLYLMNRSGWSNLYHNPMYSDQIDYFKKIGAEYLIIGDEKLLEEEYLQTYLGKEVFQHQGIFVFDIR